MRAAWVGIMLVVAAGSGLCEDRKVDPTFLRRHLPELKAGESRLCQSGCQYRAIFGEGDPESRIARSVARFGELILKPGGTTAVAAWPGEERVYIVMEGAGSGLYGEEKLPLRKGDFLYVPPETRHGVVNSSSAELRLLVLGYRVPAKQQTTGPREPQKANFDEVAPQTVAGHPSSVKYRLLVGDTASKRDKIAAGRVLTSLFLMEFEPGGTNFPHHHEEEEEIYLILEGEGEMVAGSGVDGVEGRYPARAGDAYFIRLNGTVGFYGSREAASKARILAARSRFPFPDR
jgi:mannose-6-phosphate isomerase-like protein (cupin superfamily)